MMDDMLADPELIKEVLPKTVDELFDIFEKIVPGAKKMQKPVVETFEATAPFVHVSQ